MTKVNFTFQDKSIKPVSVEGDLQGLTILDVAENNGVHLNHNCGEVCACSTCHVYVEKGMEALPEISDREEDFIDRAIDPTIDSRLGCQCLIEDGDTEFDIIIPDQSLIIGHEH